MTLDPKVIWFLVILTVTVASTGAVLLLRWLGLHLLGVVIMVLVRYGPRAMSLFGPKGRRVRAYLLSHWAQIEGRPVEAVEAACGLLELGGAFSWIWVNTAVNAMINAGLYREALGVPARWSKAVRRRERRRDPAGYLLVQVNLAEALYNLGRFGCASKVLEGITGDCESRGTELVKSGLWMQKAWLAVLVGFPRTALQHLEKVNIRALPREFRAEPAFARAAALRDLGRSEEAGHEAERGLSLSRRESSKRNALFLLASVAAYQREPQRAIELLEQGAALPYQGQGGDGLLLLGEQYDLVGREHDRRKAYEWAVQRDPQSRAARLAARKLKARSDRMKHS